MGAWALAVCAVFESLTTAENLSPCPPHHPPHEESGVSSCEGVC